MALDPAGNMFAFQPGIEQAEIGAHQIGWQAINRCLVSVVPGAAAADLRLVIAGKQRFAIDGEGCEVLLKEIPRIGFVRVRGCAGAAPVRHCPGIAGAAQGRSIGFFHQQRTTALKRGQRRIGWVPFRQGRKTDARKAQAYRLRRRRRGAAHGRRAQKHQKKPRLHRRSLTPARHPKSPPVSSSDRRNPDCARRSIHR